MSMPCVMHRSSSMDVGQLEFAAVGHFGGGVKSYNTSPEFHGIYLATVAFRSAKPMSASNPTSKAAVGILGAPRCFRSQTQGSSTARVMAVAWQQGFAVAQQAQTDGLKKFHVD